MATTRMPRVLPPSSSYGPHQPEQHLYDAGGFFLHDAGEDPVAVNASVTYSATADRKPTS